MNSLNLVACITAFLAIAEKITRVYSRDKQVNHGRCRITASLSKNAPNFPLYGITAPVTRVQMHDVNFVRSVERAASGTRTQLGTIFVEE